MAEIDRLEAHPKRSGLDLGEVEQVGHQASESVPLTADSIQAVIDLGVRQCLAPIRQRVGEAGDHGDGSLELVGHERHELCLLHHLATP